jgi:hypothetical protein
MVFLFINCLLGLIIMDFVCEVKPKALPRPCFTRNLIDTDVGLLKDTNKVAYNKSHDDEHGKIFELPDVSLVEFSVIADMDAADQVCQVKRSVHIDASDDSEHSDNQADLAFPIERAMYHDRQSLIGYLEEMRFSFKAYLPYDDAVQMIEKNQISFIDGIDASKADVAAIDEKGALLVSDSKNQYNLLARWGQKNKGLVFGCFAMPQMPSAQYFKLSDQARRYWNSQEEQEKVHRILRDKGDQCSNLECQTPNPLSSDKLSSQSVSPAPQASSDGPKLIFNGHPKRPLDFSQESKITLK